MRPASIRCPGARRNFRRAGCAEKSRRTLKTVPGDAAPDPSSSTQSVPQLDPRADVVAGDARHHFDVAGGGDARQRFAAEPERDDAPEIIFAGDLARRVALERQP